MNKTILTITIVIFAISLALVGCVKDTKSPAIIPAVEPETVAVSETEETTITTTEATTTEVTTTAPETTTEAVTTTAPETTTEAVTTTETSVLETMSAITTNAPVATTVAQTTALTSAPIKMTSSIYDKFNWTTVGSGDVGYNYQGKQISKEEYEEIMGFADGSDDETAYIKSFKSGNTPSTDEKAEERLLSWINEERKANGAEALTRNTNLDACADIRTKEMFESDKYDHIRPDGSYYKTVVGFSFGFYETGENVGYGSIDGDWVLDDEYGTKNSVHHYQDMIDPNWKYVGISAYTDGSFFVTCYIYAY